MNKLKIIALMSTFTITGIVIGRISKPVKKEKKEVIYGNIRIDRSEIDAPPSLFLELITPISTLSTLKIATFSIINENYITH